MKWILFLSLLLFCAATPPSVRECQLCQLVLTAGKEWYEKNGPTDETTFQNALLNECKQLSQSSDTAMCETFVNCQHRKIYLDIDEETEDITRTCIDIGSCDGPLSSSPVLPLVDWTDQTTDYYRQCTPVVILVLHHTVTHTALETLQVLQHRGISVQYIAGHNGTVYQMVHDYWGAWHSGNSYWREYNYLNHWSVGVEIVNTGDENFTEVQMQSVIKLSRMIVNRWHIEPRNIVGHFDIKTYGKEDPSGYFQWKYLYEQLGFFPGIFDTTLTSDQQHKVLFNCSLAVNKDQLRIVQQDLSDWGYRGNLNVTGECDQGTTDVFQAFNRHWCPEIFVIETVDYTTNLTVMNPVNQVWYQLSQERLDKLMMTISD